MLSLHILNFVIVLITLIFVILLWTSRSKSSSSESFSLTGPSCTTLSAYNNLTDDDRNPSCIPDGCSHNLTKYKQFLKDHHIVAVDQRDWSTYKYSILKITFTYNRKQYVLPHVEVWDYCSDSDCEDSCCTRNKKEFGCNFLVDIEKTSLDDLGITDWNNFLVKSDSIEVIGKITDPQKVLKAYDIY